MDATASLRGPHAAVARRIARRYRRPASAKRAVYLQTIASPLSARATSSAPSLFVAIASARRHGATARAVFARALGPGHVEVAFNVGQLAALCHVRGRHAEAARLYRRAHVLQRRAFGAGHPQLALTRANFATLRRERAGRSGSR